WPWRPRKVVLFSACLDRGHPVKGCCAGTLVLDRTVADILTRQVGAKTRNPTGRRKPKIRVAWAELRLLCRGEPQLRPSYADLGRSRYLLQGDLGALALELGLRLLGGLLVDLLQDRLRRGLDRVLGLLQAQAGQLAHNLDDLDLLPAVGLEDDVELVLLLLGRRGGGTGTRRDSGDGDRSGGLDVEGLLELLDELGQL